LEYKEEFDLQSVLFRSPDGT